MKPLDKTPCAQPPKVNGRDECGAGRCAPANKPKKAAAAPAPTFRPLDTSPCRPNVVINGRDECNYGRVAAR